MEQMTTLPTLKRLDLQAIIEIDNALAAGYDAEVRTNKFGVTVASVSKQVRYRGDSNGKNS